MMRSTTWIKYLKRSLRLNKKVVRCVRSCIFLKNSNLYRYYTFTGFNYELENTSLSFKKDFFLKKFKLIKYLYKIFQKRGLAVKYLGYVSSSLTKLNDNFYDKCFYYYFNNYISTSNSSSGDSFYNIDYMKFWEKSFIHIEETVSEESFDISSDFNNSEFLTFFQKSQFTESVNPIIDSNSILVDLPESTELSESDSDSASIIADIHPSSNIANLSTSFGDLIYFLLCLHFKYFNFIYLFFKSNHIKLPWIEKSAVSYFNFSNKLSSLPMSSSFFAKSAVLLLYNFFFKVRSTYLLFFNKFFCLDYFLKYVITQVFFFFKISYRALTKKIRKILKNKYRYKSYPIYVKPSMRVKESLRFFKKCIELEVSESLKDNIYQSIFSIIFESNDSWIIKLRNRQQLSVLKSFSKTK